MLLRIFYEQKNLRKIFRLQKMPRINFLQKIIFQIFPHDCQFSPYVFSYEKRITEPAYDFSPQRKNRAEFLYPTISLNINILYIRKI